MRQFLILLLTIISWIANSQTIEEIDRLRTDILQNLDQYKCLEYTTEKILNDDAVQYDTAQFYRNSKGELIFIKWRSRGHSFHIAGDVIKVRELVFKDSKALFKRNHGFSFKNPQWHKEPDLNETDISISESIREYYNLDGMSLGDYKSRRSEGKYKDRYTLLEKIPLEAKLQRRWSDRCDECIERDYLSIYRKLLEEKGE